ncbi:MAG TPA: Mur ligase family protein [Burkholderiaceae bacterium]|nr:Mur ligase family protein [Burkholderiaceae bacterium]
MKHLSELMVLVLGCGASGLAMARWCGRCGATGVRVWDSREEPPKLSELREALPQVEFVSGVVDAGSLLEGIGLVLKSPGLSPNDERIARLLNEAQDRGLLVQGELDLFNRALAGLKAERGYKPKVLAITGTNGKTTTTSLTALLVERAGKRVATAGNIGPTMLDTLGDLLDEEGVESRAPSPQPDSLESSPAQEARQECAAPSTDELLPLPLAGQRLRCGGGSCRDSDAMPEPTGRGEGPSERVADDAQSLPSKPPTFEHLPDVWVLELSSFQLDEVKGFDPSASTVLNITQDHLDWHGDMAAYRAAKARIFGPHTIMVINRDDPLVEAMVPKPTPTKGAKGRPAKAIERKVIRFGLDAPRLPGDFGLVVESGMAWLVRALEDDEPAGRRKGEEHELHLQRLMPADALRIRGRHNASNAMAALALATAIGCPLAPMLHGLREYTGEPHRVEYIGTLDGIEVFDDSKGTNVGATVAALDGLGADKAPSKLVVILGGDGKGQDFSPLAPAVARHARAVALIGRDADSILTALSGASIPMQRHESLEAATPSGSRRRSPAPACRCSATPRCRPPPAGASSRPGRAMRCC